MDYQQIQLDLAQKFKLKYVDTLKKLISAKTAQENSKFK